MMLRDAGEASGAKAPLIASDASLLQFHGRVLQQTRPNAHPLLERVKFLAISDSNLDEFLSLHFSLLLGRVEAGDAAPTPDGLSQTEHLARMRDSVREFMREQRRILADELIPELQSAGLRLLRYQELPEPAKTVLRRWFMAEVLPVCTPLAVDPAHPFPFISNFSLNIGVQLWDEDNGPSFARIKVPSVLPRLIHVPDAGEAGEGFIWLEDLMSGELNAFFSGAEIRAAFRFRVIRDAELEIEDRDAVDLRDVVRAGVRRRRFGEPVCIQLESGAPQEILDELVARLDLYPEDVFVAGGPLGLCDLSALLDLDRPDLKDPALAPRLPHALRGSADLFATVRHRDLILHHPYESYAPVYDFVARAAADPSVLAIKQTWYRIGRTSPLVQSLLEAVDRGKQVAVVLELQARGDEENNLEWAHRLERAGAHVSYGVIGLKTHAKVTLVVRRESDGLRRYVHVGTGNYSAVPYADLSLFTCHPEIGADATAFFNALTGRSPRTPYRRLLVAPAAMRQGLLDRIDREIAAYRTHGVGHLVFKVNSLTDAPMIDALYRAAEIGVTVRLIVRGMCALQSASPTFGDRLQVVSLVGRFLEHSRVFYFGNGGNPEVLIGSADLMERNLDRRVEVLVPVLDPNLIRALKHDLLDLQWADNARSMLLDVDGIYRARNHVGDGVVDAQNVWTQEHRTLTP
jgi:polyphosphate kinase